MKRSIFWIKTVALFALMASAACFPSRKATMIEPHTMGVEMKTVSPTKVFLADASVALFPHGVNARNDTLSGKGTRGFVFGKTDRLNLSHKSISLLKIPVDSVSAITTYEPVNSTGNIIGSAFLVLYGGILTPLSIHCITCPKCCFGSCPTVYVNEGNSYALQAEMFSYSISTFFQESDLDRIYEGNPDRSDFRIRVSNEAMETHYINQLELLSVLHPAGTRTFPDNHGEIVTVSGLEPPLSAISRKGNDILYKISDRDSISYRTDIGKNDSFGDLRDWLELEIPVAGGAKQVQLILALRNTLLSTVLFYDVVLASQGIAAVEWTERMNSDPLYAFLFTQAYKKHSGINVSVFRGQKWQTVTSLGDIGPIAWKEIAVDVPLEPDDASPDQVVKIRLEFFPDNMMIDYVASASRTLPKESNSISKILSARVSDGKGGDLTAEVLPLLEADDSRFLVTEPGESYYFDYSVQPGMNTSIFLRSKGYYREWIRGSWLSEKSSGYRFDLGEIGEAIVQLQKSWHESRELMEEEFFKTRIPLEEDQ